MNKKIIGIFVCMLFIGTTLSLVSSTYTNEYNNNITKNDFIKNDKYGCESQRIFINQKPLENQIYIDDTTSQSPKPTIKKDLPSYFSWKDNDGQDWTTPAKDQGNCGSCWDFAALGALESIIQIREECANLVLDLSEQYVLSCLPWAGGCGGGSAYKAYKAIESNKSFGNFCNGIIPEFIFPYQVNDEVSCEDARFDWKDFLIPLSTYGIWYPNGSVEDRNVMKTQIMESGPVVSGMLFTIWNHGPDNLEEWGYIHHNPADYYPYPGPVKSTNHQVVIIGWKDDSSITNGGYWIVKNSLSEEWGYNGFFNIEYGSLNIDNSSIIWVDYNPEDYSNWVPVAQIGGSAQGHMNQEMIFNGSNSFDHEGTIVSYIWDFGDGTTETGATVTHIYTQPGIYLVTLFVTDNVTNAGYQQKWIYIDKENHPPQTPTLTGRKRGTNETTYIYTFSTNDPDGDDVKYYLNWGDDYWFGGAAGWTGLNVSGEEITLEKTFKEEGNYTIRVKAEDEYGAKSDWATLSVCMPKSKAINTPLFLQELFQRFSFFEKILNQYYN